MLCCSIIKQNTLNKVQIKSAYVSLYFQQHVNTLNWAFVTAAFTRVKLMYGLVSSLRRCEATVCVCVCVFVDVWLCGAVSGQRLFLMSASVREFSFANTWCSTSPRSVMHFIYNIRQHWLLPDQLNRRSHVGLGKLLSFSSAPEVCDQRVELN